MEHLRYWIMRSPEDPPADLWGRPEKKHKIFCRIWKAWAVADPGWSTSFLGFRWGLQGYTTIHEVIPIGKATHDTENDICRCRDFEVVKSVPVDPRSVARKLVERAEQRALEKEFPATKNGVPYNHITARRQFEMKNYFRAAADCVPLISERVELEDAVGQALLCSKQWVWNRE